MSMASLDVSLLGSLPSFDRYNAAVGLPPNLNCLFSREITPTDKSRGRFLAVGGVSEQMFSRWQHCRKRFSFLLLAVCTSHNDAEYYTVLTDSKTTSNGGHFFSVNTILVIS